MGFGDNFLVFGLIAYGVQLVGLLVLAAAAGAAIYCAVQLKKVLAELHKQSALLRRLAGEPPAAAEDDD